MVDILTQGVILNNSLKLKKLSMGIVWDFAEIFISHK